MFGLRKIISHPTLSNTDIMSFELEGKLIEKYDTQQVTDKFRKREFVVEKTENSYGREFTETIKFQVTQDRCDLLDSFHVNDNIKVTFDIKGRRWEKNGTVNYFNNLEAWKLEGASGVADMPQAPPHTADDFSVSAEEGDDDLPF